MRCGYNQTATHTMKFLLSFLGIEAHYDSPWDRALVLFAVLMYFIGLGLVVYTVIIHWL